MSKETIAAKSEVIRNETGISKNTKDRIANVLDDINETKADVSFVESNYYSRDEIDNLLSNLGSGGIVDRPGYDLNLID